MSCVSWHPALQTVVETGFLRVHEQVLQTQVSVEHAPVRDPAVVVLDQCPAMYEPNVEKALIGTALALVSEANTAIRVALVLCLEQC